MGRDINTSKVLVKSISHYCSSFILASFSDPHQEHTEESECTKWSQFKVVKSGLCDASWEMGSPMFKTGLQSLFKKVRGESRHRVIHTYYWIWQFLSRHCCFICNVLEFNISICCVYVVVFMPVLLVLIIRSKFLKGKCLLRKKKERKRKVVLLIYYSYVQKQWQCYHVDWCKKHGRI